MNLEFVFLFIFSIYFAQNRISIDENMWKFSFWSIKIIWGCFEAALEATFWLQAQWPPNIVVWVFFFQIIQSFFKWNQWMIFNCMLRRENNSWNLDMIKIPTVIWPPKHPIENISLVLFNKTLSYLEKIPTRLYLEVIEVTIKMQIAASRAASKQPQIILMLKNENFHIFSSIEILFCAKYIEKMNKNTNSKLKNFPAIIRATPRLKLFHHPCEYAILFRQND